MSKVMDIDVPGAAISPESSKTVRLDLAGSDKLDKLMPTIDAMRRRGVEWREICSALKIARSWTNLYYNRWKKLTQAAETGEAVSESSVSV
jgi:hypothetical protein